MYAIIDEGGRQYKVTSGDTIRIDRAVPADQKTITFERVLLVGGDAQPKVGQPIVPGATVTAEVVGATLGPKIFVGKYKRRKGYHRKTGHRQPLTEVRITAVNA